MSLSQRHVACYAQQIEGCRLRPRREARLSTVTIEDLDALLIDSYHPLGLKDYPVSPLTILAGTRAAQWSVQGVRKQDTENVRRLALLPRLLVAAGESEPAVLTLLYTACMPQVSIALPADLYFLILPTLAHRRNLRTTSQLWMS